VPDRAYFSTLSRAWELGVGALLAVATPVLVRLPGWSRPVLSWTGLLGMTASVFVITAELAFPAPAALLPVLSTALVIAGGTGVAQQRYLAPLTNGVSQYVGDISYSLYLWHFPIIILGFTVWGSTPTTQLLLGIALLVVSAYSFHLVEDPVRRSDWLTSGRRPSLRRRGASRGPRLTPGQRVGWQSLTVVAAVALIAGLQASVPDRQPVVAAAPSAEGAADEDALPEATRALRTEVRSALAATEWPETDPSLDEAAGAAQAPDEVLQCGTETVVDVERCSWGPEDAENTVVVVGDSIAMTYVTTLRTALEDWRVVSMGGFGCTFTEPLIANDVPELEQACPARKQAAVDTINELEPDLVVVTNVQYPRLPAGAEEALTEAEWSTATLALVEEFRASAGTVVFLAPPPADKDLSACYSRVSTPEDCVSVVTQEWLDRAATERAMAEEVGGAWIDSSTWFCVERRCPAYVGSTPTKVDTTHMTPAFAEKIAPALEEALEAQDLL
jgi:hypothetical protein